MSQADKPNPGQPQQQQQHMNTMNMGMPGMQVPLAVPNMHNGQGMSQMNEKSNLNTYIYDYFLKNHMYDCAQAILREGDVHTNGSRRTSPSRRPQKHDADGSVMTNGMDETMESADGSAPRKTEDGEDSKPEFPLPSVLRDCPQGCFLFDWWCLFWDIFGIRTGHKGSAQAAQYLTNTQRIRQQQEQLMLQGLRNPQQALLQGQVPSSVMNPGPGYQNPMLRQGFPNGVMVGQDVPGGMGAENKQQHLVRQALMNNNKRGPPAQQLNALKNQQMIQQAQRDQDVDMNGQQPRPQSPAGSQAAASPGTKRRNLGGGDYQEVGPGTRGQTPAGAAGTAQANQAHQILIANGIDPNRLTPQQFAAFQVQHPNVQQKSIQLYAASLAQHAQQQRSVLQQGMPKGIPHVQGNPAGHAGSPMMPHTTEGGAPMNMNLEFYNAGNMRNISQAPGTGNHALQDYQMQLMLLEQQNKKRLLMARQEQEGLQGRAEQGNNFQGMSPQGGRAAPSPQPQGDMKRGTPKMNPQAGPGSPLPDSQMSGQQQRASPATSMPGFNAQVPLDQQMFYNQKMSEMLGANATMPNGMMRPPSGHGNFNAQMTPQQIQEQVMNPNLRQQQAGRGQPTGNVWPQQHPQIPPQQQQLLQQAQAQAAVNAQQAQQQQPQQNTGTPNQARQNVNTHTNMPPPSSVPTTQANGRAPSSPSVNNQQPPTPTQANKAAPKQKVSKERKVRVGD
ncbi:hypothetical protein BDZ91DRAFT_355188 [Kalaharituber pfeilii]|nr:hypothetical protein BDZ91DRAFT_355188 [Kalaharituber pfeilii]